MVGHADLLKVHLRASKGFFLQEQFFSFGSCISRDIGAAGGWKSWNSHGKTFTVKRVSNLHHAEAVCNYCHKRGHWKVDC